MTAEAVISGNHDPLAVLDLHPQFREDRLRAATEPSNPKRQ
jgi:hypothetical protein